MRATYHITKDVPADLADEGGTPGTVATAPADCVRPGCADPQHRHGGRRRRNARLHSAGGYRLRAGPDGALTAYQNRLLDMWESAMQAGISSDAKWHIEWLLSEEFDGLDGQTSCKNCGRHLRIIGEPHVLGTLCSDRCGSENREHYA